jgi:hypothetical protein
MAQVTNGVRQGVSGNFTTTLSWRERWESLKAGMIGAIAAGLMFGLLTLLETQLLALDLPIRLSEFHRAWGVPLLISLAIAMLAGFLFAVTYRYVIRQDQNFHLGSGAVMAFGLVRGLAQMDVGVQVQFAPVTLVIMVLESVLLFAGLRLVLDRAITQGWLKPFSHS